MPPSSATRSQWYSSDSPETIPVTQRYRNVLVLPNFEESKDAIQRHHRSNIIDVTIQTPPEGNRWLNTTALFTIAELIGPERLRTATIEDLPEGLKA